MPAGTRRKKCHPHAGFQGLPGRARHASIARWRAGAARAANDARAAAAAHAQARQGAGALGGWHPCPRWKLV